MRLNGAVSPLTKTVGDNHELLTVDSYMASVYGEGKKTLIKSTGNGKREYQPKSMLLCVQGVPVRLN